MRSQSVVYKKDVRSEECAQEPRFKRFSRSLTLRQNFRFVLFRRSFFKYNNSLRITDQYPYQPFLLDGSILATIGAGLIYTFNLTSSMAPIVGYQILYGIGTDLSVQVPIVVAGGLSSTKDQSVPTATVLWYILTANPLTYSQPSDRLHGFEHEQLLKNIPKYMKCINREDVIAVGSRGLEDGMSVPALLS
ncbi:hypothetical protein N7455_000880 [Penicillium solitum]|uniref:uncharacterized protein n=1 Tax=Penicillium solitum TaxID=60172 RepID=UPI0032C4AB9C|nr:hypothetical protein N7455_000880 [Penicillium solitum]